MALVVALSSNAELLLLDEPTAGLDPLMETVFQEYILAMAAEGRTVMLSSHILAEVEKLCDRVTIIRHGRVVQSGTLDDLRTTTRTSITVTTDRPVAGLESLTGVHALRTDGTSLRFEVDSSALDAVMSHLVTFGIRSLVSQPPTLEELFLRQYGDDLRSTKWRCHRDGAGDADERQRRRRTASTRAAATPPLAGFANLLRFMIRRDRVRAPVWIASIVGVIAASAASIVGLYDTPAELQEYADLAQLDPALKAIAGPGYGLDDPTLGAVVMNEVAALHLHHHRPDVHLL